MTIKEKLDCLEELLDIDEGTLNEGTKLDEISQWDSMAVIALIAMFDDKFEKIITPEQIKGFKSVRDILNEME